MCIKQSFLLFCRNELLMSSWSSYLWQRNLVSDLSIQIKNGKLKMGKLFIMWNDFQFQRLLSISTFYYCNVLYQNKKIRYWLSPCLVSLFHLLARPCVGVRVCHFHLLSFFFISQCSVVQTRAKMVPQRFNKTPEARNSEPLKTYHIRDTSLYWASMQGLIHHSIVTHYLKLWLLLSGWLVCLLRKTETKERLENADLTLRPKVESLIKKKTGHNSKICCSKLNPSLLFATIFNPQH